ncbi:MAG: hypothetical protein AB1489_42790, partial [Acidobacteriota bacterium]
FQNDIKVRDNLLIKAGIRYDINRMSTVPDNNGNISPRIAFVYRPGLLPQLNLRAAYGLFFSAGLSAPSGVVAFIGRGFKIPVIPFPFSVLPFARPDRRFPKSQTVPADVSFKPQLSTESVFDLNLRNSYAQQISFGCDYMIDRDTVVSLNYNFVRGIKLFGDRNINPVVRPVLGDPVQSSINGRIDPTRGNIDEFESAFDSYYHALTLTFNRRFVKRFSLLASYTFSKAIDNFNDFVRVLEGVADPLNPGSERGLSLQDARSRFVASGIWDLNYTNQPLLRNFQLSAILNLTTGRPYNLLAGVDLNQDGDNPAGDRPTGLGRNVGITPGFANFDLRFSRRININERVNIDSFVEVFNLFNRVNIRDFDRTFPPDAQGNFLLPPQDGGRFIVPRDRYQGAFSPRQVQFGFKVSF